MKEYYLVIIGMCFCCRVNMALLILPKSTTHVIPEWDARNLIQNSSQRGSVQLAQCKSAADPGINFADVVALDGHPKYKQFAASAGLFPFRMVKAFSRGRIDLKAYYRNADGDSKYQKMFTLGDSRRVALILPSRMKWENNVYHILELQHHMHCIYQMVHGRQKLGEEVKIYWDGDSQSLHRYRKDLLELFGVGWLYRGYRADGVFRKLVVYERCSGFIHDSYHWNTQQPRVPIVMDFAEYIRTRVRQSRTLQKTDVLFLQRDFGNRYAVDVRTKSFDGVKAAMCSEGLMVDYKVFTETPFEQQVMAMGQAHILIGVHGAGLTNLMWLEPGSAVIEITLRYGWCKDPVPDICANNKWDALCERGCRDGYHKADFQNMAYAYGMQYFYFDPAYVDQCYTKNPINVKFVHIDGPALALATRALRNRFAQ